MQILFFQRKSPTQFSTTMRNFYYNLLSVFSGIFRFVYRKNLRVLAFHDVPDRSTFSKQVGYLKSCYNVIDIVTLQESILNRDKKLPNYPLLITFDDGDISILKNGLPVLIDHKVSSCIFIITGYINSRYSSWWEKVEVNEKKNGKPPIAIRKQINLLKIIKNKERLEILDNYPEINQKQLSREDLLYMQQNGIFIANHSHSHPMFDKCTETEIQEEMDSSKVLFDIWNIAGFEVFAYPNGSWNQLSEDLLKKNAIKLAFLFDHKLNPSEISPLRISRIKTNADMSLAELKVKVSGLHSLLSNYK